MNRPVHNEHRRKRFAKKCPFVSAGWKTIDYKDVTTLKGLLRKRKDSSKKNYGVSSRFQALLAQAVKRARHVGLLPFVGED